jgi:hypothetical protein
MTCTSCQRSTPNLGYDLCLLCYRVDRVLAAECAPSLLYLATRSRDAILARVSRLIRLTDVSDADFLVRELERRL